MQRIYSSSLARMTVSSPTRICICSWSIRTPRRRGFLIITNSVIGWGSQSHPVRDSISDMTQFKTHSMSIRFLSIRRRTARIVRQHIKASFSQGWIRKYLINFSISGKHWRRHFMIWTGVKVGKSCQMSLSSTYSIGDSTWLESNSKHSSILWMWMEMAKSPSKTSKELLAPGSYQVRSNISGRMSQLRSRKTVS